MKQRRWIIRDEDIRARCAAQILQFKINADKPLEVVVKVYSKPRTLDQNAYYWSHMIRPLIAHFGVTEKQMSNDLLAEFFGTTTRATLSGKILIDPRRTSSELSVSEMSDYLDWLPSFIADYGIEL